MKSWVLIPLVWSITVPAWAAKQYPAMGMILSVNHLHKSFVASCKEIPGLMKAMSAVRGA